AKAIAGYAVARQGCGGRSTRDDCETNAAERTALLRLQLLRDGRVQPGFGSERVVDERDDTQARGLALDLFRHRPARQAVDHNGGVGGNRGEDARGVVERVGCRIREAAVK